MSIMTAAVSTISLRTAWDKAAECLVKVAKVVEKTDINMTAGYMLRACNLLVVGTDFAALGVRTSIARNLQ